MSTQLSIVVIAAGEGSRMRSSLPKVLHPLAGRTMLGHVLATAESLGSKHTVVVLAEHTIEQVRATFGPHFSYVVQSQRLGTGHAVLQAQPLLAQAEGDVLVLYGDSPLIQPDTVRLLVEQRRASRAALALLSFQAELPHSYGRVVRDASGAVAALVEERNATPEQRAITEANSGFMAFDAQWLWRRLPQVPLNPAKGEYYLTDLVGMAVAEFGPGGAIAVPAPDPRDAWGCNDQQQLADAARVLYQRHLAALMREGVRVVDPANTYVDAGVTVGRDSVLLPGTMLCGSTSVGQGCRIGPQATLTDAAVGDGAHISHAVVEGAAIAPGARVGPFAHMQGAES